MAKLVNFRMPLEDVREELFVNRIVELELEEYPLDDNTILYKAYVEAFEPEESCKKENVLRRAKRLSKIEYIEARIDHIRNTEANSTDEMFTKREAISILKNIAYSSNPSIKASQKVSAVKELCVLQGFDNDNEDDEVGGYFKRLLGGK